MAPARAAVLAALALAAAAAGVSDNDEFRKLAQQGRLATNEVMVGGENSPFLPPFRPKKGCILIQTPVSLNDVVKIIGFWGDFGCKECPLM